MTDPAASRPALRTRARLRAVHPLELRWVLELGHGTGALGRIASEGGLPALPHGTVSRRHFEIRWDAGLRCHVGRDLGSHNGSRVNGYDLGPTAAALHDGAVIQLGDVSLVYEEIPAAAPSLPRPADPMIPGESPVIEALVQAIGRAALEPSEVLLVGEPGTGKEHLARELHRRSDREGSLLTLDCATVDPRALELRMFGPDEPAGPEPSGAFHTERGCTLFLDAIEALSLPLQAKLLHALQAAEAGGRTEVRVVAATHLVLEGRVASGSFLGELYARFARGELQVPALRERRGDLMAWLERLHTSWIEQRPDHPVETLALTPESAERLLLHAWPGNLHELGRLVHELASDLELPRPIPLERLPGWILGATPDLPTQPVQGPPAPRWPEGVRS